MNAASPTTFSTKAAAHASGAANAELLESASGCRWKAEVGEENVGVVGVTTYNIS